MYSATWLCTHLSYSRICPCPALLISVCVCVCTHEARQLACVYLWVRHQPRCEFNARVYAHTHALTHVPPGHPLLKRVINKAKIQNVPGTRQTSIMSTNIIFKKCIFRKPNNQPISTRQLALAIRLARNYKSTADSCVVYPHLNTAGTHAFTSPDQFLLIARIVVTCSFPHPSSPCGENV